MKISITDKHKVASGQLAQDVFLPKNSVEFHRPPDTIIIHFTGGSSARSSVSWLSDPKVKASAHVVIGKEGEIHQLVPFDTIAWHAGTAHMQEDQASTTSPLASSSTIRDTWRPIRTNSSQRLVHAIRRRLF